MREFLEARRRKPIFTFGLFLTFAWAAVSIVSYEDAIWESQEFRNFNVAIENLKQVAECLEAGIPLEKADRAITNQGLRILRVTHSGDRVARFYGTGKVGEPELVLNLERDERNLRLANWTIFAQ